MQELEFEIYLYVKTYLSKYLGNWQCLFDSDQNLEYDTNNETFEKRYVLLCSLEFIFLPLHISEEKITYLYANLCFNLNTPLHAIKCSKEQNWKF